MNEPRPGQSVATRTGAAARAGGDVVRVLSFVVLAAGLPAALLLGAVLQWIFPAGIVGYAVGLPLAVIALAAFAALRSGGRRLKAVGTETERRAQSTAIHTLARRQGGRVTIDDAARELGCSRADADAVLTSLAKDESDTWTMDVEADGTLVFALRTRVAGAVEQGGVAGLHDGPATGELLTDLEGGAAAERHR